MKFSNEGKINRKERDPKIIENDHDFHAAFLNSKSQFLMMALDLKFKKMNLEELKDANSKIEYLPFLEYISRTKHQSLSPKLANDENYKQPIFIHDDLIKRIKNFQSTKELEQILSEVEEFIV